MMKFIADSQMRKVTQEVAWSLQVAELSFNSGISFQIHFPPENFPGALLDYLASSQSLWFW